MALFCPQGVRELVILVQNPLLTLPRPCFAISEYVNWLFWWKTPADALVALFCPQEVRELVLLVQNQLLTLLWSCSAFSLYVN